MAHIPLSLCMDYAQTLAYLFGQFPNYQQSGSRAIRFGLETIGHICNKLGQPQQQFPSVHIAGTNGKGSSAAMLAAALTASGYRTGLFTSPHLLDFSERIRIDGQPIGQADVMAFVEQYRADEVAGATFFEISTAMAFWYFAQQAVDVAILETGMGGRLDATNIVRPVACLITQIGMDHADFLGDTLPKIAGEKAGIIKPQTPVVVSGTPDAAVAAVFAAKAQSCQASIRFANPNALSPLATQLWPMPDLPLLGQHQQQNLLGVLELLDLLGPNFPNISPESVSDGLRRCPALSGLRGRWELLSTQPRIIADVAHNEDGIRAAMAQLAKETFSELWVIFGMVQGKALEQVLPLFPTSAHFLSVAPNNPRARSAEELATIARQFGLKAEAIGPVAAALATARRQAPKDGLILICGSTFTVAEALAAQPS